MKLINTSACELLGISDTQLSIDKQGIKTLKDIASFNNMQLKVVNTDGTPWKANEESKISIGNFNAETTKDTTETLLNVLNKLTSNTDEDSDRKESANHGHIYLLEREQGVKKEAKSDEQNSVSEQD